MDARTPFDIVTQSDFADITLPPTGKRWKERLPDLPNDWTYKDSIAFFLLGAALQEPSRNDFKFAFVELKRFFDRSPRYRTRECRKALFESMVSAGAYLNEVYGSKGLEGILDSAWGTMILIIRINDWHEVFLSALCLAAKGGNVPLVNDAFSQSAGIPLRGAALESGYEFVGLDKDRVRARLHANPALQGAAFTLGETYVGLGKSDVARRVKDWWNWERHLDEAGISKKRIPLSHGFRVPSDEKIPCVSCGRMILPGTATKYGGRCVPCFRAKKPPR